MFTIVSARYSSAPRSARTLRFLSSKVPLTAAERDAKYLDACEKMKAYYINRPPIEVIQESKRRSSQRDREHGIQLAIVASFFVAFIATPFIGREIALNPDFRKRFVPAWYDFSIIQPKSEWTRADFHEILVAHQNDLHERAIRGEFAPDKLERLKEQGTLQHRYFKGVDPENDIHGWGKLHPGLEDDEDEME